MTSLPGLTINHNVMCLYHVHCARSRFSFDPLAVFFFFFFITAVKYAFILQTFCQGLGEHLVKMESREEFNYLRTQANAKLGNNNLIRKF